MLGSSTSRFHWAKRGRRAELSFFRMLANGWRRAPREQPDGHLEKWHKFRGARHRAAAPTSTKIKWSPWLWVD